jgi:hypothetical protein
VHHRSLFARHLCLAVDAASYSSLDSVAQHDLQALLSDVLNEAAAAANLDRDKWLKQPQGDGELALIPPDQPEPLLVDDFIRELDAVLLHRNHGKVPAYRLRLRAAIDFGVAYEASFGFAGDAVVATARLLASDVLHRALADASDADLAVALSDSVYQTVAHRHTSLSAGQFVRSAVSEKEYTGTAWIRVLSRGSARTADPGQPKAPPSELSQRPARGAHPVGPAPGAGSAPETGVHNVFNGTVEAGVIGVNFTGARGDHGH